LELPRRWPTPPLVVSLAVERALDVVVAGGGVLQLLAASVPLTPGGAGTQQALIAPLSAGTKLVDLLLGLAALAICGIPPRLRALRPAMAIA